MKVLFAPITNISYYNKQPKISNNKEVENTKQLPKFFYYPINFGCVDDKLLCSKLESLEGIHCPISGLEMISEEKKNELLQESSKIETGQDFVEYLQTNKKYFGKPFHKNIEFVSKIIKKEPEKTPDELVLAMLGRENARLRKRLQMSVEYVEELQKENKFNRQDNELLNEYKSKINESVEQRSKAYSRFSPYKQLLQNTIGKMQYDDKWDIYANLKNSMKEIYEERNWVFVPPNSKNIADSFINELLNKAVGSVNKIDSNPDFLSSVNYIKTSSFYNNCDIKSLLHSAKSEDAKESFIRYIDDVSQKSIDGELGEFEYYPLNLTTHVLNNLNRELDAWRNEKLAQIKLKRFNSLKQVKLDVTEVEDVPCACCGKPTITHNQKLQLFEQITQAKDLKELNEIIDKNSFIIRKKYLPLIKDFQFALKNNPDITDEEMFKYLREKSSERINHCLEKNLDKLRHVLVTDSISLEDRKVLQEFIKIYKRDFMNSKPESPFSLVEFCRVTGIYLSKLEYSKTKYLNAKIKDSVYDLAKANTMLTPLDKTIEKFNSPTKVAIQNIFKMSVATKDHVLARNKGGSDERKNLMLLCKDCNNDKKSSMFNDWIRRKPEMKYNLQKQFDFLSEKIKKGELDEAQLEYLKELSENIAEITEGKIKPDIKIL